MICFQVSRFIVECLVFSVLPPFGRVGVGFYSPPLEGLGEANRRHHRHLVPVSASAPVLDVRRRGGSRPVRCSR